VCTTFCVDFDIITGIFMLIRIIRLDKLSYKSQQSDFEDISLK